MFVFTKKYFYLIKDEDFKNTQTILRSGDKW